MLCSIISLSLSSALSLSLTFSLSHTLSLFYNTHSKNVEVTVIICFQQFCVPSLSLSLSLYLYLLQHT